MISVLICKYNKLKVSKYFFIVYFLNNLIKIKNITILIIHYFLNANCYGITQSNRTRIKKKVILVFKIRVIGNP